MRMRRRSRWTAVQDEDGFENEEDYACGDLQQDRWACDLEAEVKFRIESQPH